jgi:hypothetical protein
MGFARNADGIALILIAESLKKVIKMVSIGSINAPSCHNLQAV